MTSPQLARGVLAVLYIWFGVFKLLGISAAIPLMQVMGDATIPWASVTAVTILLGAAEVAIGLLFLLPKCTRVALIGFAAHMVIVISPLVIVPNATWDAPLVPSLEGQYIIKNLALLVLGWVIWKAGKKTAH